MKFQALSMPFLNYGEGPITPLFEEFPSMVEVIGASREEKKAAFDDEKFRKWFREDWNHKTTSVFPRLLSEMTVTNAPDNSLKGKTFQELAGNSSENDALDNFMDLVQQYDTELQWKCIAANHRAKERLKLLASDETIPGFNDSGAHNVNMAFHDGALQTLRQAQSSPEVMSMETAIHRLTELPAKWLGLDAGSLYPGKRADIVVLSPEKLQTHLYDEPIVDYHPSLNGASRFVKRSDEVVNHVLVNGEEVFNDISGFVNDLGEKSYGKLLRPTNAN
jgi:N-acyl-D-aspartate/D-glutamate deacylase